MKNSIIALTTVIIIICGFVFEHKEKSNGIKYIAMRANQLYCCNIYDPRVYNAEKFSWYCYENGVEIEKIITWQQCYCAWQINNWNPPNGLQCDILETSSECNPEKVKSNIKK